MSCMHIVVSSTYELTESMSVMCCFNHFFNSDSASSIGTFGKNAVTSKETIHSSIFLISCLSLLTRKPDANRMQLFSIACEGLSDKIRLHITNYNKQNELQSFTFRSVSLRVPMSHFHATVSRFSRFSLPGFFE
jgi:hypothetical protein